MNADFLGRSGRIQPRSELAAQVRGWAPVSYGTLQDPAARRANRYIDGAWIVYETSGSGMFDDAGFAYLPAGPTDGLGEGSWESPRFVHLGGPWYSWTASW